ncbi:hypothetical protein [Xanthobacter wiegelii]|uniref:hypothetical protein n=1 Tax=Xanthobacter wiegelii TaxID=3119913 RepID=UPI0037291FA9
MMDTLEKPDAEVAGTHLGVPLEMDWSPTPELDFSFGPLPSHLECEALAQGFPSREGLASLRAAGVSDRIIADQHITEASARFFSRRRWDYDSSGIPVLLVMVHDRYGDVVDVIAWPIGRPEKWARLTAKANILGEATLDRAHTDPLPAYRTPLGWLAGGATGVCILDSTYVWKRLRSGPPISGEDLEHAKELEAMLSPPTPPKVYVRQPSKGRRAA